MGHLNCKGLPCNDTDIVVSFYDEELPHSIRGDVTCVNSSCSSSKFMRSLQTNNQLDELNYRLQMTEEEIMRKTKRIAKMNQERENLMQTFKDSYFQCSRDEIDQLRNEIACVIEQNKEMKNRFQKSDDSGQLLKENTKLRQLLNQQMEDGKSKRSKFKKLSGKLEDLRQSSEQRSALFDRN